MKYPGQARTGGSTGHEPPPSNHGKTAISETAIPNSKITTDEHGQKSGIRPKSPCFPWWSGVEFGIAVPETGWVSNAFFIWYTESVLWMMKIHRRLRNFLPGLPIVSIVSISVLAGTPLCPDGVNCSGLNAKECLPTWSTNPRAAIALLSGPETAPLEPSAGYSRNASFRLTLNALAMARR
jgi:hypothetical protein